MPLHDARVCDGDGGEGAGSSVDTAARQLAGDYLTNGELPTLQYSRTTLGRPPPPLYMFWGHADGIERSILSQWFPSPFIYDSRQYTCAEQWMMAEKARVFGDEETRELILKASTPKEMKALGRSIRGFDEDRWRQCREAVVMKGSLLKFAQNTSMMQFLLSTDGVLVEASPYDSIWGIGNPGRICIPFYQQEVTAVQGCSRATHLLPTPILGPATICWVSS
jgi:ribA/ribD-fused uncharacterized protein